MCSCEDGRAGTQLCRSDGTFSPCMCGAAMVDAGLDFGPPDLGQDGGAMADMGREGGIDAGRDFGPPDLGRDSGVILLPDMARDMFTPGVCGDGTCDAPSENAANCSDDCPDVCGDGYCTGMEDTACTSDCDCSVEGPDACAANARCFPLSRTDTFELRGVCLLEGSGTGGASCMDQLACAEDFVCVDTPGSCTGRCDPFSDFSGSGSCTGAGEACVPTTGLILGFCDTSCTPFSTTGCAAGEWCEPFTIGGAGACRALGTTPVGGACVDSEDCVADAYCAAGTCETLCRPGTPACGAGEACIPFRVDDDSGNRVDSVAGSCLQTCDFDGTASCPTGEVCAAGEIANTADDLCLAIPDLPIGAACTFAGATEGSWCNGSGLCLDNGVDLECFAVCREAVGTFGGPHPDCPSGDVCNGMAGDVVGVCI